VTRLIAFYLPQFHPIPENDEWWGEGFTEWTNVVQGAPQFAGHLQPRLPRALGFYDARVPETRNKQFRLARQHGIEGFCYYYYWFNGRRLLHRPIDDVLSGAVEPFPFCICWANENWTRRWDGQESDVLMRQDHTLENDIQFIRDVLPILMHPSYIRIDNKPVLLVYRVDRLSNPSETVAAWQSEARSVGLDGLHIAAVQSFGFGDPREANFDSAVEFPPHFRFTYAQHLREAVEISDKSSDFSGKVYDYPFVVDSALSRPKEEYWLHRGAMCAWDNTARRRTKATIFHNANPFDYERWLTHLVASAEGGKRRGEQESLVFINAWNEWAEGSTLEPCNAFENTFLLATGRAVAAGRAQAALPRFRPEELSLSPIEQSTGEPVLLVGHDGHRNGAQINLLHFAKALRKRGVPVTILLLGGGPLVDLYKAVAETVVVTTAFAGQRDSSTFFNRLRTRGYRRAILNTVATGSVVWGLKAADFTVVSLIHELPTLINRMGLRDHLGAISKFADTIVFASEFVRAGAETVVSVEAAKVAIVPQGSYRRVPHFEQVEREALRTAFRRINKIPPDAALVLGLGYGDRRKGIDIFAMLARQMYRKVPNLHFAWVGDLDHGCRQDLHDEMQNGNWRSNLHLIGYSESPLDALIAADVFLLTSREDPFPTVVLEAIDAGLPVVAFRGAGGFADLESTGFVKLAEYLDVEDLGNCVVNVLSDNSFRIKCKTTGATFVSSEYDYGAYVDRINEFATPHPYLRGRARAARTAEVRRGSSVSCIVPSYNAAAFLPQRMYSIESQSVPPDQLIILDDASTDGSCHYLEEFCGRSALKPTLEVSNLNSGSPFRQWAKGLRAAERELVWIAESDDFCELNFLERVVPVFRDPDVVLAYTHSLPVGTGDENLSFNYDEYLSDVDEKLWKRSFKMAGPRFVERYLTALNTIPNASAVVMRRDAALAVIDRVEQFTACGDWLFYALVAQQGKVAFLPEILNYHRRHESSVISRTEANQRYIEELLWIAREFIIDDGGALSQEQLALLRRVREEYARHKRPKAPDDIADHPKWGTAFRALIKQA